MAANCPRMKTWPVSITFFCCKNHQQCASVLLTNLMISNIPELETDTQTFHNDSYRAESFPVFPVFNVFVINHWSADTESRVSWVSGPRSGSGNLAPPSVGEHYTTLHNAQIWNTRTLTFNRENMLYIFPSRECLRFGKCIYVDQSPNLKWISKNIHSLLCSFDYL